MTQLIHPSFTTVTIQRIEEEKDYDSENKSIIVILLSMKVCERQKVLKQYT